MNNWLRIPLLCSFLALTCAGCIVGRDWPASLPRMIAGERVAPIAICVKTTDERPNYSPYRNGLAMLPLVPYATSTSAGHPELTGGGDRMEMIDYQHLIPLMVARGLRDSNCVFHATCEERRVYQDEYEAILEITLNDAHFEQGLLLYGMSLYGAYLWFVGFPAGTVGLDLDVSWTLREHFFGKTLAAGTCRIEDSLVVGLYYNGGYFPKASLKLHKTVLPRLVTQIVNGVRDGLKEKPESFWSNLVASHEQERIRRGEALTYKWRPPIVQPQVPMMPPPPSPVIPVIPSRTNCWAVVVGADKCEVAGELDVCAKDARSIRNALLHIGYPAEQVTLLTDGKSSQNEWPSRGKIRQSVQRLVEVADKEDTVLFFFSGHGMTRDGEGYLLPTDGNRETENAVSVNWIKTQLARSEASTKLLILDACHAGAAKGLDGIVPDKRIASGIGMLLSCDREQRSWPDKKSGHSIFTQYLLDGLNDKAAGEDKKLTLQELHKYVRNKVKRWTFNKGKDLQTPVLLQPEGEEIILVDFAEKQN